MLRWPRAAQLAEVVHHPEAIEARRFGVLRDPPERRAQLGRAAG